MKKKLGATELSASVTNLSAVKALPLDLIDSVYLGNPYCLLIEGNLSSTKNDLLAAVDLLKTAGRKAYLTTPVVSFGSDFEQIISMVDIAIDAGLDAVEVQDVGVFNYLRRERPNIDIHMGHFINIYNEEVGRLYTKLGASRIIPSYELTLSEKAEFLKLGLDVEVPIHGHLPIGMAQACLLAMELPSREPVPCTQQCREVAEVVLQGWKMRCSGKCMLMSESLTMIEYLVLLLDSGFHRFRVDMMYDEISKIPRIANIYHAALADALESSIDMENAEAKGSKEGQESGNQKGFDGAAYLSMLSSVLDGEVCNGWYFGASGRLYVNEEERIELEDFVADSLLKGRQKLIDNLDH